MLDYQYELNGFLMGAGTSVRVTKVEGLFALPDVVSSDEQRDDGDGEYSSGDETLAGRTITFEVALEVEGAPADELYEKLQAATSVIRRSVPLKIQRPGRPERQVNCKIRRREFTSDAMFARGLGAGAVELKALDPRIYSSEEHSLDPPVGQYSLAGVGGVTFPMLMPLKFNSTPQPANVGIVRNAGTYPTPAVIRIFGPITDPVLENMSTGEDLVFNTTLGVGEYLEIDLDVHTIRLNGVAPRANTLDRVNSSWFLIEPGVWMFRLRGSDTNYLGTFDVTWRDAWA